MRGKARGIFGVVRVRMGFLLIAAAACALLVTAASAVAWRGKEESVEVPIVMYHSVLRDEARHGQYVISPDELESDFTWLKAHGYTPVLIQDLIAYTHGGSLPEKPIVLTFDDGYYNNYVYAYPLAQRLGCKFVLSVIGYWADHYTDTGEENAYYSHATWGRLTEMVDSGLVELQNHSYNLHTTDGARFGAKRIPGEDAASYAQMLRADLGKTQAAVEAHTGKAPTAFTYPFGAYNESTAQIVRDMGFACTLTCAEKVNVLTREPESLFGLGRFLRPSGVDSETFFTETMGLG